MININSIKEMYEKESQVKRYTYATMEIGLWESEKILFPKYFNKKQNILDIGCGTGRTTISLYKLGFSNIIGLDLSANFIKAAKSIALKGKLDIKFIIGNVLSMDIETNFFEGAIFSFNGLMQIPDKKNRLIAMKEIFRILKNASYFIFTTHTGRQETGLFLDFWNDYDKKWNSPDKDKRLIDYGDRFFINDDIDQFIHIPTQIEVKNLINETGFELVECRKRSEICIERKEVLDYSVDCLFWIVYKK